MERQDEQICPLDLYDPATQMAIDGFFLVLGPTGAHKTTWVERLLQQDPYIKKSYTVVLCGSYEIAVKWMVIVPQINVLFPPSDYIIPLPKEQLKQAMKKKAKQGKRKDEFTVYVKDYLQKVFNWRGPEVGYIRERIGSDAPFPPEEALNIVFDDIALYPEIMREDCLRWLAGIRRHILCRCFFLGQTLMQLVKQVRGGFGGGVFCCGSWTDDEREEVWTQYCRGWISLRKFNFLFQSATNNKGLFVIEKDKQTCSHMLMGEYPFERFCFGRPTMQKFSELRYCGPNDKRRELLQKLVESGLYDFLLKESNNNNSTQAQLEYKEDVYKDKHGTIIVRTRTKKP